MATEMKSRSTAETQTRATDSGVQELDAESLAAIRDLIATEPDVFAQPVAERVAENNRNPQPAPAPAPKAAFPQQAVRTPEAHRQAGAPPDAPRLRMDTPSRAAGRTDALKRKITGYRPTPRHLIWASVGLLVLLRPWLVLGFILLGLVMTIALFLILGYDGFWSRAMKAARWYANRRPHRAAELHRKLDGFAVKWDAVLDRFPEGTVDGLYLPDFGELATADKRHDEAMERRLALLRQGKA